MSDFKLLVDWVVNAALNLFNMMRDGAGVWFYVWIAALFAMPRLKKLLKILVKGG